jgi:two-component system nitrate/nitrite response regulator NarL
MKIEEQRTITCPTVTQSVMIVSDVQFIRESLSAALARASAIRLFWAIDLADAQSAVRSGAPDIILLDVTVPNGSQMVEELRRLCPGTNIVALGLREKDEDVLTWAEAGIAGYVPNTSSISELLDLIDQIGRGEQTCSARIAGTLLRRIAWSDAKTTSPAPSLSSLTRREVQVLDLIGAGFSNKAIARQLHISVSTAKTHVHHLLSKLHMTRRANVMVGMRAREVPGRGCASP